MCTTFVVHLLTCAPALLFFDSQEIDSIFYNYFLVKICILHIFYKFCN